MSDGSDYRHFHAGDYLLDIIVTGFPGKSVCHGSLGFSTIVLVRHGDRVALMDVGSFGQRKLIVEALARHELTPADVTDVVLSHCHYDHAINWVMFANAGIVIGREELDWSVNEPWGSGPVPELYVRELSSWPRLRAVAPGDAVFPGMTAHAAPGHTPGSLVYVLDTGERDFVFTGDACKNRAELLSRAVDMTFDADDSRRSIESIWRLWAARPGNVLIPGHDLPMVLENDAPRYLGEREAAIRAWYDDSLDKTTVISLVE